MDAKNVKPQKWTRDESYPIRVLYDDGEYSIIWGKFEDNVALGARWNGGKEIGYPGQGGNPTWYVEPDFIAISIIQRILTLAIDHPNCNHYHLNNIKFALAELTSKMLTADRN